MKKHLFSLGLLIMKALMSVEVNAQTITAPTGQPLTITNSVDVTATSGSVNVPSTGSFNIGTKVIVSTKGLDNLLLGENAGLVNTGAASLFIGANSGLSNTTGTGNMFIGQNSGRLNTTGGFNMLVGISSGFSNSSGYENVFIGNSAGYNNTTGFRNLFVGSQSGFSNVTGKENSFFGTGSGYFTTAGEYNTFIGGTSGYYNTTGSYNAFFSLGSGALNTTGSGNTALGVNAGYNNTTGGNNTFIGINSGPPSGSGNLTFATAIGAEANVTSSNSIVLGRIGTNVGIGNTAPSAKLHITSGIAHTSGLRLENLTNGSPAAVGPTGTNGKVLSVDGSGNVILVQITGAGVSTQSVGEPVSDVVSKKVDDLANQVNEMKSVKTTWVEKDGDGFLRNVSPNGVVIEGKGFEGQALIVKGKMLSEEVNVKLQDSDWPDYVFKPNYKRMTLGEVEKFISINGHLPNVPSATEMAATGNNLGKTDVKLLEKVEELTLYLLDMKKANDAQAAELKALKQQVSKLRKK